MVLPRDAKSSMMLRPLTKNDTVPSPQFHLRQKVSASELSAKQQQQQATAAMGSAGASGYHGIGRSADCKKTALRRLW